MLSRIDRVSTLRCQVVAGTVVWAMNCRQFICTCSPVSTLSSHPQIPQVCQMKPCFSDDELLIFNFHSSSPEYPIRRRRGAGMIGLRFQPPSPSRLCRTGPTSLFELTSSLKLRRTRRPNIKKARRIASKCPVEVLTKSEAQKSEGGLAATQIGAP